VGMWETKFHTQKKKKKGNILLNRKLADTLLPTRILISHV
jgi:hypothetical protein